MKTVKQVKEELRKNGIKSGMLDLGLIEVLKHEVSQSEWRPKPDHQRLIDLWHDAWLARFKFKYIFSAADCLAVKRVLRYHSPKKVMEMVEAAWAVESDRPFWHCFHMSRSLVKFVSAINEIGAELSRMKPEKETDYTHF